MSDPGLPFEEDLERCLDVLGKGGTILYPTDTVWGIGCDATDAGAVERVLSIKGSPFSKSMLVILDDARRLAEYVRFVPDIVGRLIEEASRPLTVIYPGAKNLAENLPAGDGSIGIRITGDPFCKTLVSRFGKPIVSTSANISSHPAPAGFADVSASIRSAADYVVRWRQDDPGRAAPSRIMKIGDRGKVIVIRE